MGKPEFKMGIIQNMSAHHVPWAIDRKHTARSARGGHPFHDKYFTTGVAKEESCGAIPATCSSALLNLYRVRTFIRHVLNNLRLFITVMIFVYCANIEEI